MQLNFNRRLKHVVKKIIYLSFFSFKKTFYRTTWGRITFRRYVGNIFELFYFFCTPTLNILLAFNFFLFSACRISTSEYLVRRIVVFFFYSSFDCLRLIKKKVETKIRCFNLSRLRPQRTVRSQFRNRQNYVLQ